ncbi:hypothetical protein [Streptomyces chartreusis]
MPGIRHLIPGWTVPVSVSVSVSVSAVAVAVAEWRAVLAGVA